MRLISHLGVCFHSRNSISVSCRGTFLRLIVCEVPVKTPLGNLSEGNAWCRWDVCLVWMSLVLDGLYTAPLKLSQRKTGSARLYCVYVMMCHGADKAANSWFPMWSNMFSSAIWIKWCPVVVRLVYFCCYNWLFLTRLGYSESKVNKIHQSDYDIFDIG